MATIEPNINVTLFQELKKKYPDIPDYVVTSKMQQVWSQQSTDEVCSFVDLGIMAF